MRKLTKRTAGDVANAALISAEHQLEQLQMVFKTQLLLISFSDFSRNTARTDADLIQNSYYYKCFSNNSRNIS
jgi:hypothetical protein